MRTPVSAPTCQSSRIRVTGFVFGMLVAIDEDVSAIRSPVVTSTTARPRRRSRPCTGVNARDTLRGSFQPHLTDEHDACYCLQRRLCQGFRRLTRHRRSPRTWTSRSCSTRRTGSSKRVMVLLAVMFVIGLYIIIYKRMYIGARGERIRAVHRLVLAVARHRADLQAGAGAAEQPDLADVRRRLHRAREARLGRAAQGRSRRQPREHRARAAARADRRDHQARVDGAVPRDHRLGGAVHRPVRHRHRHPVRVPRHRRFARKRRPRRSRPSARTSPRRCSRPRSASSPRSRPSWRTTTSRAGSACCAPRWRRSSRTTSTSSSVTS